VNVTILTAADVARYRALMLEAYAQAPDAFTSTPDERAAEPQSWWLRRIADPGGLTVAFGAFQDHELVGTVALEFSAKPKTRHKALLIGMYVTPLARGCGAGAALITAAMDHLARRPGITVVTLTVTLGNESAIRLYEQAGFAQFGVEPMAILTPSGYRAKVHMHREVQGV
jgi:RimJ/RimL family protein N-acetyltransferase